MSVSCLKLGSFLLAALGLCACGGGGGGGAGMGPDDPNPTNPGSGGPPSEAFSMQVDGAVPTLLRGAAVEVPLRIDRGQSLDPVTLSLTQVDPALQVAIGNAGSSAPFVRVTTGAGLDAGSYPLVVRGTRGTATQDLRIVMDMPGSDADFEIVAPVQALDLAVGERASLPLRVQRMSGSMSSVAWTIDGAPSGLSTSVLGDELVVDAFDGTPSGSHDLTATASSGGVVRSTSFLVRVLPESISDGLSVEAPTVVRVRQGASTDAQISVARDTGVVGNVNLTAQMDPTVSVSGVFADQPLGLANTTLSISAALDAPLGESVMTVLAGNGVDSAEASVLVQVVPVGTPDLRVQRVEFAQVFFGTDPVLVGDKDTILRAHVVSDQLATAAPVVRVEGLDNGVSIGSLPLSGPAVLPTGVVPGDMSQSFTATLPASWIRSGLELRIMIDPADLIDDAEERNDVVRLTPRIGDSQGLQLVIVPLIVGGRTPNVPSDYGASMEAMWPLSDVDVTVRAPYTVTSVTDVASDGTGWSSVLSELRSLRFAEGNSGYYYGVLRTTYGSGVAGMGYVGFPSAIGWDRNSSTTDVMLHELGHNFGLRHAPCGGPSSVDTDYPYSDGRVGVWGYDRRSGSLVDRRNARDVMTYCGPEWVSDYNHDKVRDRLTGSSYVAGVSQAVVPEVLGADVPLWSIRGVLKANGQLQIDPASPMRTIGPMPADVAAGKSDAATPWLRVESAIGAVTTRPLRMLDVGCNAPDGERHFEVTIVDPGSLASWSIVDARGAVLDSRFASPIAYSGGRVGTVLEESGGKLRISWNDLVAPRVTVMHVGTKRTALGIGLGGGSVVLPTDGLPDGGVFELQWTDGLNSWVETRVR